MQQDNAGLPHEIAGWFTEPFARFLKIQAAAGVILLLAALAALILSNSAWSAPYMAFWETPFGFHFGSLDVTRSLRHWVNDGLMTLFFFVVSLELKRELSLRELRNLRMAALSFAGALGGMLVPALFYLAFMTGRPGMHGWGTVMATDSAFVMGCLALFGPRIQDRDSRRVRCFRHGRHSNARLADRQKTKHLRSGAEKPPPCIRPAPANRDPRGWLKRRQTRSKAGSVTGFPSWRSCLDRRSDSRSGQRRFIEK